MGGDQLIAALIGDEGEKADGESIREAEGGAYGERIDEVQAMDGASGLLRELREDGPAVMVGDSTWDVKAAEAAGILTLAVLSGGFSAEELQEAGAGRVVESIGALRKDLGTLAELAR